MGMGNGKRTLAAWVVGAIIFFAVAPLVPGAACKDGTASASIGRRGACSHHGGVSGSGGYWFLLLAVSAAAGFSVSRLLAPGDGKHRDPDTAHRRPMHQETTKPPVSGYLSPQEYDELQLRMGMSKEQVESQRASASILAKNKD